MSFYFIIVYQGLLTFAFNSIDGSPIKRIHRFLLNIRMLKNLKHDWDLPIFFWYILLRLAKRSLISILCLESWCWIQITNICVVIINVVVIINWTSKFVCLSCRGCKCNYYFMCFRSNYQHAARNELHERGYGERYIRYIQKNWWKHCMDESKLYPRFQKQ